MKLFSVLRKTGHTCKFMRVRGKLTRTKSDYNASIWATYVHTSEWHFVNSPKTLMKFLKIIFNDSKLLSKFENCEISKILKIKQFKKFRKILKKLKKISRRVLKISFWRFFGFSFWVLGFFVVFLENLWIFYFWKKIGFLKKFMKLEFLVDFLTSQ